MAPKKQRIYIETSVWNFPFIDDAPQHRAATLRFFEQMRAGRFDACVSELVIREIQGAPEPRRAQILGLLDEISPAVFALNQATLALAEEFIAARMVSAKHANDAIHIASAVVRNADVLLSWNFRHIVKLQTRRLVTATSMVAGYKPIEICTPEEVTHDNETSE